MNPHTFRSTFPHRSRTKCEDCGVYFEDHDANPVIQLDAEYSATIEDRKGEPVIVVFQNGRRTPGQWFASTLVEGGPKSEGIYIDFGAGWQLSQNATALLYGFAVGAVQRAILAEIDEAPRHTVRGQTSENGWPYGTTHDNDCPACLASGSSFTASPRSESYWSS